MKAVLTVHGIMHTAYISFDLLHILPTWKELARYLRGPLGHSHIDGLGYSLTHAVSVSEIVALYRPISSRSLLALPSLNCQARLAAAEIFPRFPLVALTVASSGNSFCWNIAARAAFAVGVQMRHMTYM
jgi:hypothetical protein